MVARALDDPVLDPGVAIDRPLRVVPLPEDYWTKLYRWFASGGDEIVASYLRRLDLSGFNAKAPPPKTQAFWEIVDASRAPEDAELADALDALDRPDALSTANVIAHASETFAEWLRDRKNSRKVPHRLEACGYVRVRNSDAQDGLWKVGGKRQAIYAKQELPIRDQIAAARQLSNW
jgi:hypothetical protein